MGLLNEEQWKASWIGWGDGTPQNHSEAFYLAHEFQIPSDRKIIRARAYVSGLGLCCFSLNGREADESYFSPGESDYSKTVYYKTYDIEKLLHSGTNAVGLHIGNGQYVNYHIDPVMVLPDAREAETHRYQKNDSQYVKKGICGEKKAIAQIEITYEDGKTEIADMTGREWKIAKSPVIFNNWYGGEDYDARKEIEGWNEAGSDRRGWKAASQMRNPMGRLKAWEFGKIEIVEKFPAVSVKKLENGNYLADMGRNLAGFTEIVLENTTDKDRGKRVEIFPAEILREDNTGVDQSTCTQSWNQKYHCCIKDSYVIRGTGREIWHPVFTYHGFRYIEVRGFPDEAGPQNFYCCVLRMDNEKTGEFQSSDPIINEINILTERSVESNMFFTFTDCPQIEKLGWAETSHLMFRSMASGYDIRSWIGKIVQDMADSQVGQTDIDNGEIEEKGYVPAIIPEYFRISGLSRDVNWGGACVLTPWEYYQYYGDPVLLNRNYDLMKGYLEYLQLKTVAGMLRGYSQMGDWGQIEEDTPVLLVENCAYYYLLSVMSKAAEITGHPGDIGIYRERADIVRKEFHKNRICYRAENGNYGNGSQASYGCVLFSGIVLPGKERMAAEKLEEAVKERGYHLSSGEVGLKQVFSALARYGKSEVVYKMVMNETPPSYRSFVEDGLTALPEYWNYRELWYGMARSRNHAMMGHVREWLTSWVAGIRSMTPGFGKTEIAPSIPHIVERAAGCVMSPYGKISVEYRMSGGVFILKAGIPAGVTADIQIPDVGAVRTDCRDCRLLHIGSAYRFTGVGAGTYEFKSYGE